jgi:hypothetical protein
MNFVLSPPLRGGLGGVLFLDNLVQHDPIHLVLFLSALFALYTAGPRAEWPYAVDSDPGGLDAALQHQIRYHPRAGDREFHRIVLISRAESVDLHLKLRYILHHLHDGLQIAPYTIR